MKTYEYKGYDGSGSVSRGIIEALDIKDARRRLADDGVLAESVEQTGRRLKFPVQTRTLLYRELGALLEAGVPLVSALDMLVVSPELSKSRVLLAALRDSIKEGGSLADAMSEVAHSISGFERAVLESAAKTATMPQMLQRLAMFMEEQENLKERIQSALIYPCIVVTCGICAGILMLGLLLPRTNSLLSENSMTVPAITEIMVGLGSFVLRWGWVGLVLVLGIILYFKNRYTSDEEFRLRWSRKVFGIPVWGRGMNILVNLRFSRTLAILLNGGVSLVDGLILAGRATGNYWVSHRLSQEAEAVRNGDSLSDAIGRIQPLAEAMPGWIRVGEASGGVASRLQKAGEGYERQWDRFITRSLAVLEPIMLLLVGSFVLLVILSVLLPILSFGSAIGK